MSLRHVSLTLTWLICNVLSLPLDCKLSEGQNRMGFIPEFLVPGCCPHFLFQTQSAQWQEPKTCSVSPCEKTRASMGPTVPTASEGAAEPPRDGCSPGKPAHTPLPGSSHRPPLGSPPPRGLCTLSLLRMSARPFAPLGFRSGRLPAPPALPARSPAGFPRNTLATGNRTLKDEAV